MRPSPIDQSQVDGLFQAYARICVNHDADGWLGLLHPETIRALSGGNDFVLRFHQIEAFRSPHATSGWDLAPVWESTGTSNILQFVPSPFFVARRIVELPLAELKPVIDEYMLAEYHGDLRFVLRDYSTDTHRFLRDSIARQEERWAEARNTVARLGGTLIEGILTRKRDMKWMAATRFLRSRHQVGPAEALAVVQVVWADAPPEAQARGSEC